MFFSGIRDAVHVVLLNNTHKKKSMLSTFWGLNRLYFHNIYKTCMIPWGRGDLCPLTPPTPRDRIWLSRTFSLKQTIFFQHSFFSFLHFATSLLRHLAGYDRYWDSKGDNLRQSVGNAIMLSVQYSRLTQYFDDQEDPNDPETSKEMKKYHVSKSSMFWKARCFEKLNVLNSWMFWKSGWFENLDVWRAGCFERLDVLKSWKL